jgi:hypothetical protein
MERNILRENLTLLSLSLTLNNTEDRARSSVTSLLISILTESSPRILIWREFMSTSSRSNWFILLSL